MQIDVWTLGLQTLNLLALLALLRWLFYKPLLRVIDQRRQAAAATLEKAEAARREAESQAAALAEDRRQLEASRRTVLDQAAQQAEAARASAQQQSSQAADAALSDGRRRLADERREAERQLRDQAVTLAVAMARRVLAQSPGTEAVDLNAHFMDAVLDRLENHPPAERATWFDEGAPRHVTVATAAPLPETALQQVRPRLQALLGGEVNIAFETDPDLLAGAELRFPHVTIGHHWAGDLEDMRASLSCNGATDTPVAA